MAMTGKALPASPDFLPREEAATLDLEHFLPYRLSLLSNRISQTIADLYAERFGIGVTEWRVIAVLGRYAGLSANEVAERTAMDKVAVSRSVASLLEKGLLLRALDGADRRRSLLRLSRNGQRLHAQVAPLALDIERRLLEQLDADDRRHLARMLDALDRAVDRLP